MLRIGDARSSSASARELELAFFVPLLIGHGNFSGQVVSTVIRALGSGAATLRDAPRVILKEATAGVMQSPFAASSLLHCISVWASRST